jgi:hypothetical protein
MCLTREGYRPVSLLCVTLAWSREKVTDDKSGVNVSIHARLRRALRPDRGASAVEFAIVAPLLIVLVLGIINFGALFGQQLALHHAVREGARAAVVQSTGQGADVPALVQGAVSGIAMDPADVAVTSGACAGDGGKENLTVTATYPAELLAPMPIPGFPDSFNLSADAVFRCEW